MAGLFVLQRICTSKGPRAPLSLVIARSSACLMTWRQESPALDLHAGASPLFTLLSNSNALLLAPDDSNTSRHTAGLVFAFQSPVFFFKSNPSYHTPCWDENPDSIPSRLPSTPSYPSSGGWEQPEPKWTAPLWRTACRAQLRDYCSIWCLASKYWLVIREDYCYSDFSKCMHVTFADIWLRMFELDKAKKYCQIYFNIAKSKTVGFYFSEVSMLCRRCPPLSTHTNTPHSLPIRPC